MTPGALVKPFHVSIVWCSGSPTRSAVRRRRAYVGVSTASQSLSSKRTSQFSA
jgi:hypothetical protein